MATSLDRLIRKEVSLGAIREKQPPQDHVILSQIAPFLSVPTDDVIFDYIKGGYQDGLAPQRAEDAEAELSQKDDLYYGQGRAAIVDWSLKDKYTASDVQRYREDLFIAQQLAGVNNTEIPLNFTGSSIANFQSKVARHDARRRRFLDNRLEKLGWDALTNSAISYNDGKIKWTVNYGRPSDQTSQAPASGLYNTTTFDPIGDFEAVLDLMYTRYGTRPKRVYCSQKLANTFWKSDRFIARTGLVVGGTPSSPIDMNYLVSGWSKEAALQAVATAVGCEFIVYDSVYRTRPIAGQTFTNNRFSDEGTFYFLPANDGSLDSTGPLGEIDDTAIGFAKMLTSPHPEGNWQSGYYEWEVPPTQDPWMLVRGSGIKAFPVFPYMEQTYTMKALP